MANELSSHIVEGSTITNKYESTKASKKKRGPYDSSVQAFQRFSVSVVNLKHAFHSYILITN
jgi:hypothetical protein